MTSRTVTQRLAVLFAVGAVIASVAWADGYRNPPESASALGRDGGKIANIDDPSAATINPANLADMQSAALMQSTTIGYAKRTFTGPSGVEEESNDPWAVLPSAYGVLPLGKGDYVLGVGVTLPFGRSTTWDETVSFARASPYFAELYVLNVNPSIAKRLTKNLAVAVGASVYQSQIEFKQKYAWAAATGNASDPDGDAHFEGDGNAFGFNAALTWDIAKGHVLGLTYRSPFDVEYDGDFSITELPAIAAAVGATAASDFSTEVKFPTIVGAGYSYAVTETVRLAFDVEWAEHSRNESLPIKIGNNSFLLPATSIPQDWNDNWTYGFGLEWACTEAWTLRGGCTYLETPAPTKTLLPVGSEEDAPIVSIGCGYRHAAHKLDLAYAVGIYDGRTVADNVNPFVNGQYDIQSQLLAVSYGYSF
jgi:long-chain fatty acid transport protein